MTNFSLRKRRSKIIGLHHKKYVAKILSSPPPTSSHRILTIYKIDPAENWGDATEVAFSNKISHANGQGLLHAW